MTRGLEVGVLPAGEAEADGEVDRFFEACPRSFAQQTPGWRDVITGIDADEPLFLGCRRGGDLVGVLPAYRYAGPAGAILTSVPQAGPLGGVACLPDEDAGAVYAALLHAFAGLARDRGCALATAIGNPFWDDGALYERHFQPDYILENACLALDLEESLDADGGFPLASSNLRRNLRRAEAGDLVVDEEQSADNLSAWYAIHVARHGDLGATPLPQTLFTGALEHMVSRDKARFFFIRRADTGEMVAGGFYLIHAGVVDALMPSVLTEHAKLGANFLLAAHSIRWARARGIRYYNWQASPPDGGVYRFKRQWGSREFRYGYYTRVTGDAEALLASTPEEIRADYPWHYVLPYDRLGSSSAGRVSSRKAAWTALESSR